MPPQNHPLALSYGRAVPATSAGRVLIVSNRLPLTASVVGDDVELRHSSGGLATGLRGVHERSHGLWLGWSGAPAGISTAARLAVEEQLRDAGAVAVPLSAGEIAGFYQRYSNTVLWPALHGWTARTSAMDWATYRTVNARYADAVATHARAGDRVWIHDYQLMLVPRLLRGRCPGVRVGFFLHTPFPEPEALEALPERGALLDGLLGADVVAFHTREYAQRFVSAVRRFLPYDTREDEVQLADRVVSVFASPMGIDAERFATLGRAPGVIEEAARIRARGAGPLFVGVDRLDYTKGIPQRLAAFERLLAARPALRGRARLLQLCVPSREDVQGYRAIRVETEALVARINERFGGAGCAPVEYRYGSVDAESLVALYRAADVMLVTPLCDGMNLVAKEFVASRVDDGGVLVLSARAGAAAELRAALQVDPYDVEELAGAYDRALEMSAAERRVRMRRMRRTVRTHDVFRWAGHCLEALGVE